MAASRTRSELQQRREELTRSMPALTEDRATTFRRTSDSSALNRTGVRQEGAEQRTELREAEAAADGAFRDAQRELRAIDEEIAQLPRRSFGAAVGGVFRRRDGT